MSEELHSCLCELVLEAVEKHGGDINVSTDVKTLIAANEALLLVCAAVHWALTPHEQPIKVQSIRLDKRLSAQKIVCDKIRSDLFSRIVVDEAHHGMSDGNDNHNAWNQVCHLFIYVQGFWPCCFCIWQYAQIV